VTGLENLPRRGPALLVTNHLGDADFVVGLAVSPIAVDLFAKAELFDYPLLGKVLEAYGVIWIHRGQPDRRALRAALQGFDENRVIAIAPEGRESLSGALEAGTGGAAFLALKGEVSLVPITFTGTENQRIFENLKRLRRSRATVTIGLPFRLNHRSDRRNALEHSTETIMLALARQLPVEYQGVYRQKVEQGNDHR
jgi:1-acyl-sn-glycerol-3-phosphate acyltransferase